MNPATILALIAAATKLLEITVPLMTKLFAGGEATTEEQARVRAAVEELRTKLAGDLGDHWKL